MLIMISGKRSKALVDLYQRYAYGIEWDLNVAASATTRLGRVELSRLLPIQSRIRRCVVNDAGQVVYYLHPTNSALTSTGSAADLSGADGQVMVETPSHYRRFETEGTKVRALISEIELPGFHYVPRYYRSAYEASVDRTVAGTPKLSSVMNTTANFRGGANTAAWDLETRSLLGRPASNISMTTFRSYARNRGSEWNCDVYEVQKTWYWLYAIEYANFNAQLPFNASPSLSGYKQGGLGDGVTTLNSTLWSTWNGYNPFVPCGYTNRLGNASGVVPFEMPAEYGAALTVGVPSYRGLEHPFGHIWKITDGCKVKIQSEAAGGKSEFYVCSNPAQFQDSSYANYLKRGELARTSGYIKQMLVGEFGDNMPVVTGGAGSGSTTYFADYFYTDIPAAGEFMRAGFFGGHAADGATAGLGYSTTNYTASHATPYIGSRLCILGA